MAEKERVVATFETAQARGGQVAFKWLSELEGTQGLREALGGDACVISYSAADWAIFTEHQTFDDEGNKVPDEQRRAVHQFTFCLRQGPGKNHPHVIPMSKEGFEWALQNLSNHHLDLVRMISDELSGWDLLADPFGKRKKARRKPSSAGGALKTSGGDSTS